MQYDQEEFSSMWDEVKRSILGDNARQRLLISRLTGGNPFTEADYAFFNLLLSEDQGRRSTMVSEATIELTKKMVRWSRLLAVLTGVLAFAALADIVLRILFRMP
jgi:hypothetical protein